MPGASGCLASPTMALTASATSQTTVAEAASLGPVTVDGDPLVVQGPGYEAGNDHPVVAGLAGADGVEEAEGHDRQAVLLVVG